jgi:hypothetical protein
MLEKQQIQIMCTVNILPHVIVNMICDENKGIWNVWEST